MLKGKLKGSVKWARASADGGATGILQIEHLQGKPEMETGELLDLERAQPHGKDLNFSALSNT